MAQNVDRVSFLYANFVASMNIQPATLTERRDTYRSSCLLLFPGYNQNWNLSTSDIIQSAQGRHCIIGSLLHDAALLDNPLPVRDASSMYNRSLFYDTASPDNPLPYVTLRRWRIRYLLHDAASLDNRLPAM